MFPLFVLSETSEMLPWEVYPWWGAGSPCSSYKSLILSLSLRKWEIQQESRSLQGSTVHIRARKEDLGQQKDPQGCPLALHLTCGPEVWPSGLCLASAATLWKPQSWQLSPRICSITEQRPRLLHCLGQKRQHCWCPQAPSRRRAPNCTDPQFPLLLQLGPQTHHQSSLLNPQTGLLL